MQNSVFKLKSPYKPTGDQPEGIYTRGVGYAAWSSAEESIYFFFIVNDISICPTLGQAWNADGIELFVKHGDSKVEAKKGLEAFDTED